MQKRFEKIIFEFNKLVAEIAEPEYRGNGKLMLWMEALLLEVQG